MPELPEVETVRRGLAPVMEGARLERLEVRRPDLRFPLPTDLAPTLEGRTIVGLGRRAKYLTIAFDGGPVVISHLGMSGSYRIETTDAENMPGTFHHERGKLAAHDHLIFHLTQRNGHKATIVYNDPRRFGFIALSDQAGLNDHPHLRGLGLEPTGNGLDGQALADRLAGRRTPLKAALLDQRLIAGLGNIYVNEALWRAHLSPRRRAASIVTAKGRPTARCTALAQAIRTVIAEAIQAGGSSLRDYTHTDGTLGYFQHRFAVYDRVGEPCTNKSCGGTIARFVQSGRSTFYCPTCQR